MSEYTQKIIGYALTCLGVVCMLFSAYSIYEVFTNVTKPPEIFKLESLSVSIASSAANLSTQISIPLEPEIRKIFNIFLYYLFMMFILTLGSRISSLGMQFIKEQK